MAVISSKYPLFLSMVGVGVAWASILSCLTPPWRVAFPPEKTGTYMGIFNLLHRYPGVLAAPASGKSREMPLTNESVLAHLLGGDNRLTAVVIGGISRRWPRRSAAS